MNYFLSKFLPMLIMPLSVSLILVVAGGYKAFKNKQRSALFLLCSAFLILYFHSIPLTVSRMARLWEGDPEIAVYESIPQKSAIVVLGGITERLQAFPQKAIFGGGVDRLLTGIELWRAKRAPFIIITAGSHPNDFEIPEAVALGQFAVNFANVSPDSLLIESKSINTLENAYYTGQLLDSVSIPRDIILVTSATHMRRAAMIFRNQGFTVYSVTTDFAANLNREMQFPYAIVPAAENLVYVSRVYREILGYYWQRGISFK